MKKALFLSLLALSISGLKAYTINDNLTITGNTYGSGTIIANNGLATSGILYADGLSRFGWNPTTSTYLFIVNNVDQSVIMTKAQGDISMGAFGN